MLWSLIKRDFEAGRATVYVIEYLPFTFNERRIPQWRKIDWLITFLFYRISIRMLRSTEKSWNGTLKLICFLNEPELWNKLRWTFLSLPRITNIQWITAYIRCIDLNYKSLLFQSLLFSFVNCSPKLCRKKSREFNSEREKMNLSIWFIIQQLPLT